jgi:mono/diheme cytochrome c family protein
MKRNITFLILFFLISGFAIHAQVNNPWVVPEMYKEMVNPVDDEKTSIERGKNLYAKHCLSCHGLTGQGDGAAATELKVDPSDLSLDDLDVQKDGEIYFKIERGRDEMHKFKNIITEDDIWDLVNYIRTFYQE